MLMLLTLLTTPCWATADDDKARQLFIVGREMFNDGRLEEAIENWEQSYSLSARTLIQFNLAEAYERVGRFQSALDALLLYQPDAEPNEVDRLEARIASLRTRVSIEDKEKQVTEAERRSTQAQLDAERMRAEELAKKIASEKKKGSPLVLPLIVTGAGLGLVGVGVVTGLSSASTRSELKDPALCSATGVCKSAAEALVSKQKNSALISDITLFSGVAVVAAGSALMVMQLTGKSESEKTAFWVAPTGSGAIVGVRHAL